MNLLLSNIILLFILSHTSEGYPSSSTLSPSTTISDACENFCNDVLFFLYTRSNPEIPQQLQINDDEALTGSFYDVHKATKFMTHGWLNSHHGLNCKTVRQAFLEHDDYNVIVVDWNYVSKLPYILAVSRIKEVGERIARMINFLEIRGSDVTKMSLVGHSLGAHVMGSAGYQTTNKVGHVVGLDPAGPLFENLTNPERSLTSQDALLVEAVHTNDNGWGLQRPVGHIDFYPNGGGPYQPGCNSTKPGNDCDHNRAYELYAEAVTRGPSKLLAVKCDSWTSFLKGECEGNERVDFAGESGIKGTKFIAGSYYLRTAAEAPFGLGSNGTRPVSSVST